VSDRRLARLALLIVVLAFLILPLCAIAAQQPTPPAPRRDSIVVCRKGDRCGRVLDSLRKQGHRVQVDTLKFPPCALARRDA
jgi:rhodanese-related sulfurtransferase